MLVHGCHWFQFTEPSHVRCGLFTEVLGSDEIFRYGSTIEFREEELLLLRSGYE